jgi:hypothetical protein
LPGTSRQTAGCASAGVCPEPDHRDDPTVRLITGRDVVASCLVGLELGVLVYLALRIA